MRKGYALAVGFLLLVCTSFAQAADKPVRIGISQIVEHPALDATRKGFADELAKKGYVQGKNVEYDYKNAQNNRPVSGQIARKFIGDKVDLILAISTPSFPRRSCGNQADTHPLCSGDGSRACRPSQVIEGSRRKRFRHHG